MSGPDAPRDKGVTGRAAATRTTLMRVAERLYAEQGIAQVSNRQIALAAGQANNTAVSYHFGDKPDIIAAISQAHVAAIAQRTTQMLNELRPDSEVRDKVACLICPYADHLASLGSPSWTARFIAQVRTDPTLAHLATDNSEHSPVLEATEVLRKAATRVPPAHAVLRQQMMQALILHTCAERERSAQETQTTPDWPRVASALTDTVTAIYLATPSRTTQRRAHRPRAHKPTASR